MEAMRKVNIQSVQLDDSKSDQWEASRGRCLAGDAVEFGPLAACAQFIQVDHFHSPNGQCPIRSMGAKSPIRSVRFVSFTEWVVSNLMKSQVPNSLN